jgi:ABC-type uncharacterized transport system substrate-binding protein
MNSFVKEMRKIRRFFVATLSFVLVLVLLGMGYACWRHSGMRLVRIAVVIAKDKPSHQRMYEGVCRKLELAQSATGYLIQPFYYVAHSLRSLDATSAEVARWNPVVVVTAGVQATEMCAAHLPQTPCVWIDIPDFTQRGIGGAGVYSVPLAAATVPLLIQALKPACQEVVILYNAAGPLAAHSALKAGQMQAAFAHMCICASVVACKNMHEVIEDLYQPLRTADVLITLEDDPLEEYASVLVDLCNKTTTTFFCGGLAGSSCGAAIAFGGHQQVMGKAAFGLVQKIVEERQPVQRLEPIAVDGHRQCIITSHALAVQDMQPIDVAAVRLRMIRHEAIAPFLVNLLVV